MEITVCLPDGTEIWHSDGGLYGWISCISYLHPKGASESPAYINNKDGKADHSLCVCGELDIVVEAAEVHDKVIQFLRSITQDHKGVINMSELEERFVGCPAECIFFEVLYDKSKHMSILSVCS